MNELQFDASRAQIKQILTLCGKAGLKDRRDRLDAISEWVGRTIYSTTELTNAEAVVVIGEIKHELEKDDADYPTPPPPVGP